MTPVHMAKADVTVHEKILYGESKEELILDFRVHNDMPFLCKKNAVVAQLLVQKCVSE